MEVSKTMQKKGSEGTENPKLSPVQQAATRSVREEENVKTITSDENPQEDAGARKVLLMYTRQKSSCNEKLPNIKDLTKDDDDDRVLRPRRAKQPKESEVVHNRQKQKQHTTRDLSSMPEAGNNHQKELESRNGQNEEEIPPRVWFKIDSLTVCLPALEPDASSIYQASIRRGKEPQGGNAPDIDDGEKVHQTEPVTKPEGAVGSDVNTEDDDEDQVQQAASKDLGGGSDYDIELTLGGALCSGIFNKNGYMLAQDDHEHQVQQAALKDLGGGSDYDIELTLGGALRSGIFNKNGYMLAQDDRDMHMKQNPLTILDGKKRSSPERGEETRKNNRFRLFGHDISCEKKQAIWERGKKQPAAGDARVRFLGADIFGEQVRPDANGIKDGGSSQNHVQGSDHDQGVGKSSMQKPKSGLCLFGLDL